jgi:hypothetical protein
MGDTLGRYDTTTEAELKAAGRSRAYVKMTRAKTNSWAARLSDLLFPTDERNWGIQPTPVPTLAKKAQGACRSRQGGRERPIRSRTPPAAKQIAAMADDFAKAAQRTEAEIEEAKKRCEAMETAIEDQLIECNYGGCAPQVIEDACKLGTGILKGRSPRSACASNGRRSAGWVLESVPTPCPSSGASTRGISSPT